MEIRLLRWYIENEFCLYLGREASRCFEVVAFVIVKSIFVFYKKMLMQSEFRKKNEK